MNSDIENLFCLLEVCLDEFDVIYGELLYRFFVIGLGIFIGMFLVGVFFVVVNFCCLGWVQEVGKIWLVGFCLFVLLLVLGVILLENIFLIGFMVVQIFGMVYYVKLVFGLVLDSYKVVGGVFIFNWWVVGIGLLFMLVVLLVVILVVMLVV